MVVPPDESCFRYTGRVDFECQEGPLLTWPGSQVTFRCLGRDVAVQLADRGEHFYQLIVNGDASTMLTCQAGSHSYRIDPRLLAASNEITLFKRNESFQSGSHFQGIALGAGGEMLEAPAALHRRIEFYGASVTCGTAVDATDEEEDNLPAKQNNRLAFGCLAAQHFAADYRCISRGGIGVLASWGEHTMPQLYDRLRSDDLTHAHDFSAWTPDVVVLNLLQNDSVLVGDLDPVPTDAQIIDAYANFIRSLRRVYPAAQIVCTLGSMGDVGEGSVWRDYVRNAVASLAAAGDTALSTCFIPGHPGFSKHPRARHHRLDADYLTTHIAAVTGW